MKEITKENSVDPLTGYNFLKQGKVDYTTHLEMYLDKWQKEGNKEYERCIQRELDVMYNLK